MRSRPASFSPTSGSSRRISSPCWAQPRHAAHRAGAVDSKRASSFTNPTAASWPRLLELSDRRRWRSIESRSALEGVAPGTPRRTSPRRTTDGCARSASRLRTLRRGRRSLGVCRENRNLHATIVRMSRHRTAATLLRLLKFAELSFQYRNFPAGQSRRVDRGARSPHRRHYRRPIRPGRKRPCAPISTKR